VRYPDVVVEYAGANPDGLVADRPVLIVEVLSATSVPRDLGVKPAEYASLPTLAVYIVARQDRAECVLWPRGADGAFAEEPVTVDGHDAVIEVAGLGVYIPLAGIYRGIRPA